MGEINAEERGERGRAKKKRRDKVRLLIYKE